MLNSAILVIFPSENKEKELLYWGETAIPQSFRIFEVIVAYMMTFVY